VFRRTCIVCGFTKATDRCRLTDEQRNLVFLKRNIYVPPNSRCCKKHLYNKQLTYEALSEIKSTTSSYEMWGAKEITECLDGLRAAADSSRSFDFDNPSSMTDYDYVNITGLNKGNNYLYSQEFDRLIHNSR